MQARALVYFLLFSVAPGLLYQFVQDEMRPNAEALDPMLAYALGVAPNALGALSASSAMFLMGVGLAKGRRYGLVFLASLSLGLIGLWGWEALQLILPGFVFDPHDLAWTLAGSAAFAAAALAIFPEIRTSDQAAG